MDFLDRCNFKLVQILFIGEPARQRKLKPLRSRQPELRPRKRRDGAPTDPQEQ